MRVRDVWPWYQFKHKHTLHYKSYAQQHTTCVHIHTHTLWSRGDRARAVVSACACLGDLYKGRSRLLELLRQIVHPNDEKEQQMDCCFAQNKYQLNI